MKTVGLRELKNRLSECVREVRNGERIVVTDRGEPVAVLVPSDDRSGIDSVSSGLAALASRGVLRLARASGKQRYPMLPRILKPGRALELLDEERGDR